MNIQIKTKRYIGFIICAALLASLLLVIAPEAALAANAKGQVCNAIGGCSGGGDEISGVIATVINILSAIGGIIAVIMIIIGGFRYLTSAGDSNSTNSARNTILYAIVGLIVVALAQIIVQFVLGRT